MWEYISLTVLTAGFIHLALRWLGDQKVNIPMWAAVILAGCAGFFLGRIHSMEAGCAALFLSAHIAFFVYCLILKKQRLFLSAIFLCLMADSLWIPLNMYTGEYRQYALLGLILFLALLNMGLYRFSGSFKKEWLTAEHTLSLPLYIGLSMLPLSGVGTMIAAYFLTDNRGMQNLIPLLLIYLVSFAAVLFLQRSLYISLSLSKTNKEMDAWQKGARDYMNIIRSQRHDFNIHIHAMNGMIQNGEYEKCREYMATIVEKANEVNAIMPIYDPTIGSMLYDMAQEAKRRDTYISYDIKYDLADVACNAYECNRMIGNLLQNALDAAISPEAKEYGIHVSILKRSGNAVIRVSNYYTGDPDAVLRAFDVNYTTKKNHEGIGLSMIEQTLKKYGGNIFVEWEEHVISFVMRIPNIYRERIGTDDKDNSGR